MKLSIRIVLLTLLFAFQYCLGQKQDKRFQALLNDVEWEKAVSS
jgi:hypothetical protein